MKRVWLFSIIFIFVMMNLAYADTIITNSDDWRDVYSTSVYGNLVGNGVNFLVSDNHATLILNAISKETKVKAFSSKKNSFMIGYESILEARGYDSTETIFDDFNLELGEELTDVTNFIIIDDAYGYNAISIAPYVAITDSYVFFADSNNIDDVDEILQERTVENIIIYGHVDREVKETLAKYNPEIINKDGDRFYNNIEIVKKYQELKHAKQAILTNGEFIEKEIMSGAEPVLFIGTTNVPEQIKEYIQSSEIDIGVLIGNELVGTATNIRRQVGISVFVKFAQGARANKGAISQVEALDMFYLPTYILNIELDSVTYNKATKMLEVSIQNTENQAVYFKGTYRITDSTGTTQSVGDLTPLYLDGNELKTMTYGVETMSEGNITGEAYVIYGESKGSMEKAIDEKFIVGTIEVFDECEIKIVNLLFEKRKKTFHVEIKNTADVKCYADSEVIDLIVNGKTTTFGSEDIIEINPGKTKTSLIKTELTEEDFIENEEINIRVHYGQRENGLIKVKDAKFALEFKGIDYITFTLIVIIITLLVLIFRKRLKKK
jgi:hypothetical protein